MNNKILTISIAAYNMEEYIRQTLESLCDKDIIDKLEVFVIDDGGIDGTMAIAQEYAKQYPQSIFPIHKENEGYGSTIDYSIVHATGKYFKLLDGDDWFDTVELKKLVDYLQYVKSDIIISSFFRCSSGRRKRGDAIKGHKLNTDLKINDIKSNCTYGMWTITYKTEILKKHNIKFPTHCLYTDQIFSVIPFAYAKTIRYTTFTVYCYRVDREGQSVDKQIRIKHIKDNIRVCDFLFEFYKKEEECHNKNIDYILRRTTSYANYVYKTYLLQPVSPKVLKSIAVYDQHVKKMSPDIYKMLGSIIANKKMAVFINVLRICHYGKAGEFFMKVILPKNGIDNWT